MRGNKYKPSMFLLYTSFFVQEIKNDTWTKDTLSLLEHIQGSYNKSYNSIFTKEDPLAWLDKLIEELNQ